MSKSFLQFSAILCSFIIVAHAGDCTKDKSQSGSSSYSSSYSSSSRCPKNERFIQCPEALCIPLTCDQLGEPIACPLPGPDDNCPGKPRCICKKGYVRDCKGLCIPKKKCSSCGGDPNARAGCGFDCAEVCSGRPKPEHCYCDDNGCECKQGHIYDDYTNKCVKPDQCSKPCPINEVYSTCANGGCGKWNCTQVNEPDLCIDPIECEGGCVCQKDYLRARNGTCIPIDACYIDICEKENEIYDTCPKSCPYRTCGIDDRVILCAPSDSCLEPTCRCQDGFYRNKYGDCVLWEDCPEESGGNKSESCSDEAIGLLSKGNIVFNSRFLYEAYQLHPGQSMIMSPFSVLIILGMLGLRAEDDTLSQILTALNLRDKNDIRCVFPTIINQLRSEEDVVLRVGARMFTTNVAPLNQDFVDETKNIFDAPAESLDFTNSQASADRINEWVAGETNDRIKDIATPDMFNADTRLVLANAIYFLGNWVKQFDGNNTEDRDFYIDKQTTIKVPTMYQESYFQYGESNVLDAKLLRLYYKGNFSFFVILPNDVEGLPQLIDTLQDPDKFNDAYNSTTSEKVQLYLPKFKKDSKFDLSAILRKIGVIDLFESSKSVLTNILQDSEPLSVSAAIQKAFIEVDETGTEAAAANHVIPDILPLPPLIPLSFVADHPFAYQIVKEGILIFSGVYNGCGENLIFVGGITSVLDPPPPVYIFNADHPFVFYILNGPMPLFCGVLATIIVVGTTSVIYPPPPVYIFNADHPFVFYILNGPMPLFCGVFAPYA